MGREAYIIPGYGMAGRSRPIIKIADYFKKNRFESFRLNINWKYNTMSDYLKQFNDFYKEKHIAGNEVILFGFSWGAMISLLSAREIKPKSQILCSLSPYFKEDLSDLPKISYKFMGKKRFDDFKKISLDETARNIKTKTILVVGSEEGEILQKRVRGANNKICSELIVVKGANHNLDKLYLGTLEKIIKSI